MVKCQYFALGVAKMACRKSPRIIIISFCNTSNKIFKTSWSSLEFDHHSSSLIITHHHPSSPIITHHHPSSSAVIRHHPPSSAIVRRRLGAIECPKRPPRGQGDYGPLKEEKEGSSPCAVGHSSPTAARGRQLIYMWKLVYSRSPPAGHVCYFDMF